MEKKGNTLTLNEMFESITDIIGNLEEIHNTKIDCPVKEMEMMLASAYMRSCILRGSSFEPNDEVNRNIRATAKWMADPTTKPWLLMWGRIGSGKSTLAEAITLVYKGLQSKRDEAYRTNICVKCTDDELKSLNNMLRNVPDFVAINATDLCYFAENKPEEYAKIVAVPVLVIDDLGTEPVAIKRFGTNTQPIVETLYDRYDNMLATVITSNMDIDRIGRSYGERIKDRMREMCNILEFKHDSYRR